MNSTASPAPGLRIVTVERRKREHELSDIEYVRGKPRGADHRPKREG